MSPCHSLIPSLKPQPQLPTNPTLHLPTKPHHPFSHFPPSPSATRTFDCRFPFALWRFIPPTCTLYLYSTFRTGIVSTQKQSLHFTQMTYASSRIPHIPQKQSLHFTEISYASSQIPHIRRSWPKIRNQRKVTDFFLRRIDRSAEM